MTQLTLDQTPSRPLPELIADAEVESWASVQQAMAVIEPPATTP